MYKTVRHGENSLQYKILAQEEEGVPSVKRRRSPKAVAVKLVAIMTLLIAGVIASAFLVPLLLTNDFIAVTGTFQKFSVSTLRRSHSGNHVVVIAKKPYGWNAPHTGAPPSDPERAPPATEPPPAATRLSSASAAAPRTTSPPPTTTIRTTANESGTETTAGSTDRLWALVKFPPTKALVRQEGGDVLTTKLEPLWYKPLDKWELQSSGSYVDKANGDGLPFLLLTAIALLLIVSLLVAYCLFKVAFCGSKLTKKKETAESKEHRRRLLKSSASSGHEEE